MDAVSIYITTASVDEARAIGRALVAERLAACANVIDGMRSIYRWQGRVEEADEAVLILKTRAELVDRVTERARALHSYHVPCIVAWPIVGGAADYIDWIAAETGPDPATR